MTLPPVALRDPYNDADWETPTTKGSDVTRATQRNIEIADRKRRIEEAKRSGSDPGQSRLIMSEAQQYSGAPQDQAGVRDETGLLTPEQTVGSGSQIVRYYVKPGTSDSGNPVKELGIPILSQWREGDYIVYKIPSGYDVQKIEELAKGYGESKPPTPVVDGMGATSVISTSMSQGPPTPAEQVLGMSMPYSKMTPQEKLEVRLKTGYQEVEARGGVGLVEKVQSQILPSGKVVDASGGLNTSIKLGLPTITDIPQKTEAQRGIEGQGTINIAKNEQEKAEELAKAKKDKNIIADTWSTHITEPIMSSIPIISGWKDIEPISPGLSRPRAKAFTYGAVSGILNIPSAIASTPVFLYDLATDPVGTSTEFITTLSTPRGAGAMAGMMAIPLPIGKLLEKTGTAKALNMGEYQVKAMGGLETSKSIIKYSADTLPKTTELVYTKAVMLEPKAGRTVFDIAPKEFVKNYDVPFIKQIEMVSKDAGKPKIEGTITAERFKPYVTEWTQKTKPEIPDNIALREAGTIKEIREKALSGQEGSIKQASAINRKISLTEQIQGAGDSGIKTYRGKPPEELRPILKELSEMFKKDAEAQKRLRSSETSRNILEPTSTKGRTKSKMKEASKSKKAEPLLDENINYIPISYEFIISPKVAGVLGIPDMMPNSVSMMTERISTESDAITPYIPSTINKNDGIGGIISKEAEKSLISVTQGSGFGVSDAMTKQITPQISSNDMGLEVRQDLIPKLDQAPIVSQSLKIDQRLDLKQKLDMKPDMRLDSKLDLGYRPRGGSKRHILAPPLMFKEPETRQETAKTGFDVLVRRGDKRGSKYVKIGSNVPRNRALNMGVEATDNYIEASFKLRKTGKHARETDDLSPPMMYKYRRPRPNSKLSSGTYVEKKEYRLDTPTEVKQISYFKRQAKKKVTFRGLTPSNNTMKSNLFLRGRRGFI